MKALSNNIQGKVTINLKYLMDEKNISINQMSKLSNLRYETIRKYYKNEVYLLDIDVLAKLCFYLDCDISDLLTYNKENITNLISV